MFPVKKIMSALFLCMEESNCVRFSGILRPRMFKEMSLIVGNNVLGHEDAITCEKIYSI